MSRYQQLDLLIITIPLKKEQKNKKDGFNLLFMNPRFFIYASVVTITWDSQKALLQLKNTITLFGYSTRWMYKVTFSSL